MADGHGCTKKHDFGIKTLKMVFWMGEIPCESKKYVDFSSVQYIKQIKWEFFGKINTY